MTLAFFGSIILLILGMLIAHPTASKASVFLGGALAGIGAFLVSITIMSMGWLL
jgi:hypothetical protein